MQTPLSDIILLTHKNSKGITFLATELFIGNILPYWEVWYFHLMNCCFFCWPIANTTFIYKVNDTDV
jgi:hypothetical protein